MGTTDGANVFIEDEMDALGSLGKDRATVIVFFSVDDPHYNFRVMGGKEVMARQLDEIFASLRDVVGAELAFRYRR